MSSATSSPARIGSVHGKNSGLISGTKILLSEQHQRLSSKNGYDLELIDDLRTFIKSKCSIEKDYSQALIKLSNSHQQRKYPQFSSESDSEIKSLYTAWKNYLEEMEKMSKNRLTQFEQIAGLCDTLKHMKTHKSHIGKKCIDTYLRKMQDELVVSVNELEKNKKAYFDEEHYAKQARDKEEKLKKRKGGIFSKFTDLQSKKEKTSAHREASDIQSTQARNEYLMALAACNAHLHHYYTLDLPALMQNMDDEVLDKCRSFMLQILQSEMNSVSNCIEGIERSTNLVQYSSADFTNTAFLSETTSACIRETVQFDFDPCDGDNVTTVSGDHNAELALQHEVTKWMSCFSKECRNLNRLSQQLIKCQTLQANGNKTVEVTGIGQVEIEARIEDIKQQLRKCDISKAKARARLAAIKESGTEFEDFECVENQISTEIKQASLDVVDVTQPLSRTPSMRSTNLSEGRMSSMEAKSISDDQPDTDKDQTPEPREYEQERPASESPERENNTLASYQYDDQAASWSEYDPDAAWGQEDTAGPEQVDLQENVEIDVKTLVGKVCSALYQYEAQNGDELTLYEGEMVTIVEAVDNDWLTARNDKDELGYIPAAYVQVVTGDVTQLPSYETTLEESYDLEVVNETEIIISEEIYVKAIYEYCATSEEEISFQEGDVIKVLQKSDDGWWTGEKDGIVGHFPSMLVADPNAIPDEHENEVSEELESIESGEHTPEFVCSPDGPPPPSFAPPKPAYLAPTHVVIIQPTPEIESRGTFGDKDSKPSVEEDLSKQDENENNDVTVVVNPDFTLDKPSKKMSPENSDDEGVKETVSNETVDNPSILVSQDNLESEDLPSENNSKCLDDDEDISENLAAEKDALYEVLDETPSFVENGSESLGDAIENKETIKDEEIIGNNCDLKDGLTDDDTKDSNSQLKVESPQETQESDTEDLK